MTAQGSDSQTRLIKSMAHPLRHQILIRLNDGAASPSTLARELEQPLGNVAYHVKILLEHDAIELVETKPVRGAIEHIYRATVQPFFGDQDWARVPRSLRQGVVHDALTSLGRDVAAAAEAGELDDPGTHVSWTELELDRQGYDEVARLLAQMLERAQEIQAESAKRLAGTAAEEREVKRTALGALQYPRAAS